MGRRLEGPELREMQRLVEDLEYTRIGGGDSLHAIWEFLARGTEGVLSCTFTIHHNDEADMWQVSWVNDDTHLYVAARHRTIEYAIIRGTKALIAAMQLAKE